MFVGLLFATAEGVTNYDEAGRKARRLTEVCKTTKEL